MRYFLRQTIIHIVVFIFFLPIISLAKAQTTSEQSAKFIDNKNSQFYNDNKHLFIKAKTIENILVKYQSPLVNHVNQFVYVCQKYQIDCYLLPSISGLESTFGRFIYPESFNPFGWGGGYIMFKDWNESIETVGRELRETYINKGADTVEKIGIIYSESPTWSQRVKFLINIFVNEEERLKYLFTKENLSL